MRFLELTLSSPAENLALDEALLLEAEAGRGGEALRLWEWPRHAVVRVTFKDAYTQVAQIEDVPIKVLQTSGPYPDTVDLAVSPLTAGRSAPFRLIFEHISDQWNQAYPDLQITDVTTK